MIYRVIGDLHGRTNWKKLIEEPWDDNITYIFVGDYTDPYYYYEKVTFEQMMKELKDVIKLKKKHPNNVILLVGNHDLQYIIDDGETNRYDRLNAPHIADIFKKNKKLFTTVAYAIGEKYLISHAGVTLDWYKMRFMDDFNKNPNPTLQDVADHINNLYNSDYLGKKAFNFSSNCLRFDDYYGTSETHSPLWIRPTSLWEFNLFGFDSGKIQIVGHTRHNYDFEDKDREERIATYGTHTTPMTEDEKGKGLYITDKEGVNKFCLEINNPEHVDIILVDCLAKETACIEIDEDLNYKKISKD